MSKKGLSAQNFILRSGMRWGGLSQKSWAGGGVEVPTISRGSEANILLSTPLNEKTKIIHIFNFFFEIRFLEGAYV